MNLKILGVEICYNRTTKTYYYCNDFKMELNISLKVITEGNARNLYGGSYFLKENYFPARFLQGTKLGLYCQIDNKKLDVAKVRRNLFYIF